MKLKTSTKRPRIRVCWLCSHKLWGNRHIEMVVDNHSRILHKQCAEFLQKENDRKI